MPFTRKSLVSFVTTALLAAAGLVVGTQHIASAGLEWGTSSQLLDTKTTNIALPSVAISADGKKAVAVWRWSDGTNAKVQVATANVSGTTTTWSSATTLGQMGTLLQSGLAGPPVPLINRDGTRAVVLWMDFDTNGGRGKAAVAALGSGAPTWSAAIDVLPATNDHRLLTGALSGDGSTLLLAWKVQLSGAYNYSLGTRTAVVTDTGMTLDTIYNVPSSLGAETPRAILSRDGTKGLVLTTRSSTIYSLTLNIAAGVTAVSPVPSFAALITPSGSDGFYSPDFRGSVDGSTVVVVARKQSGVNHSVVSFMGTRGASSVTWAAPTDVATGLTNAASLLAMTASDNLESVAASWAVTVNQSNVSNVSTGSVSGGTATWGAAASIESDATASSPIALSMSGDGASLAGFWVSTLSTGSIRGSLSSATVSGGAATWASPTRLEATIGATQSVAIATSTDGKSAVAVFTTSTTDSKVEVRAVAFGAAAATTTTTTTTIAPAAPATSTPSTTAAAGATTATTSTKSSSTNQSNVKTLVITDPVVYTAAPAAVPVNAAIRVLTPSQAQSTDIVSQTPATCLGAETDLVFIDSGSCVAQVISVSTRKVIRTLRTKVVPSTVSELKVGNAVVTLAPLYFFNGTTTLRPGSTSRLTRAASAAKRASRVLVVGHTGNLSGNTPENQALSTARANLIVSRLTAAGIKQAKAIGVGALAPVSSSSSQAAQDRNRRVIVVLIP